MPPKKKKPGKNGYWEFVLECRDKHPNKNQNMSELQTYASRKWANMTKEEKAPYEHRAQLSRDTYQPNRLTTDGREIDEVEREEKEAASKLVQMKNEISKDLKAANFSDNLAEKVFLIAHINHLVYVPAEERFYICEIAIAAVTLKNGVEDVYHAIVKPGKLPLGFFGPSRAHSKETHQLLDIVQEEPYEDNTQDVFNKMRHFMKSYSGNNTSLILYVDEKTFEMTTKVIATFREDFECYDDIKVYNLQYLFFCLRNTVAGTNVWPTETFAYSELDKDVYNYTANIACDYHDMSDISTYCSKSIVTRHAYTICDHCCADLKIALNPGFHVPSRAKVVTESRTTSKAPSVCSTDDNRSGPWNRGNSFGSASGFDSNFPPLGSSKSTASSVVSFSSLKGPPTKAAARLEQSFKALSFKEAGSTSRDHSDLKFPQRGGPRK